MVESGRSPIVSVGFSSRRHAGLPVEVLERREVLQRVTPERLARPERPDFHALMLMRSGGGTHHRRLRDHRGSAGTAALGPTRPRSRSGTRQRTSTPRWCSRDHRRPWSVLGSPVDPAIRDLDSTANRVGRSARRGPAQAAGGLRDSVPERRLMVALFDALLALSTVPERMNAGRACSRVRRLSRGPSRPSSARRTTSPTTRDGWATRAHAQPRLPDSDRPECQGRAHRPPHTRSQAAARAHGATRGDDRERAGLLGAHQLRQVLPAATSALRPAASGREGVNEAESSASSR